MPSTANRKRRAAGGGPSSRPTPKTHRARADCSVRHVRESGREDDPAPADVDALSALVTTWSVISDYLVFLDLVRASKACTALHSLSVGGVRGAATPRWHAEGGCRAVVVPNVVMRTGPKVGFIRADDDDGGKSDEAHPLWTLGGRPNSEYRLCKSIHYPTVRSMHLDFGTRRMWDKAEKKYYVAPQRDLVAETFPALLDGLSSCRHLERFELVAGRLGAVSGSQMEACCRLLIERLSACEKLHTLSIDARSIHCSPQYSSDLIKAATSILRERQSSLKCLSIGQRGFKASDKFLSFEMWDGSTELFSTLASSASANLECLKLSMDLKWFNKLNRVILGDASNFLRPRRLKVLDLEDVSGIEASHHDDGSMFDVLLYLAGESHVLEVLRATLPGMKGKRTAARLVDFFSSRVTSLRVVELAVPFSDEAIGEAVGQIAVQLGRSWAGQGGGIGSLPTVPSGLPGTSLRIVGLELETETVNALKEFFAVEECDYDHFNHLWGRWDVATRGSMTTSQMFADSGAKTQGYDEVFKLYMYRYFP